MKLIKSKSNLIILILIFSIFCFMRFYNLEQRIGFDWDQERDAFVARQFLIEKKPFLIGPRVLGPEGFYLGPYFNYLLIPFYAFRNLNPDATILFLITYNLMFFIVTYLVLKRIFNFQITTIFLLIWSVSPNIVNIDIISWNPLFVPLTVILVWMLTVTYYHWKWFLLGILAGIGVNTHFQLILILPFLLAYLLSYKNKTVAFLSFLPGFIMTFIPLILFDLKHQFLNTNQFLKMFLTSERVKDILSWVPVWNDFSSGYIKWNHNFSGLIFYFFILTAVIYLYLKQKANIKKFFQAILVTWLFVPVGFALFGNRPSGYYFNVLHPFIVLILSFILLKIMRNYFLTILVLLLMSLFSINDFKILMSENKLSLYYKNEVAKKISEMAKGKKINVSYSVPVGYDTGYRYLLDYYNVKQTGDFNDHLIQIVIPPEKATKVYGGIGIKIPEFPPE